MKAPNVQSLDTSSIAVPEKQTTSKKAKKAIEDGEKPAAKTFNLQAKHLSFITKEAFRLSEERGKMVNASEALRTILDADMERSA